MKYNVKSMSDDELHKALEAEKVLMRQYDINQQCRKIALNSMYGSLGNEYSRWFDVELAEAITLSGQLSIQWIANMLNRLLNRLLKTTGVDYVIASDTDSVYLRLGTLVDKSFKGEREPNAVVDFLDKFCQRVLQPMIEKEFKVLAETLNAYENKMVMDREVIAQAGVWTAKKRYMLSVWDAEGVRYKTPKFKIMGMETARSSTPAYVRKALKTAIEMVLVRDEPTLQAFVKTTQAEFKTLSVEDIASPRSVSEMEKWRSSGTIYKKATPIAVKAAMLYNHLLVKHKLQRKYRAIGEGEKMKFIYLKSPNPLQDTVIGFPVSLPKEFGLERYVNRDLQFNKTFLEPLRAITDAVGWSPEERASLDSLFA